MCCHHYILRLASVVSRNNTLALIFSLQTSLKLCPLFPPINTFLCGHFLHGRYNPLFRSIYNEPSMWSSAGALRWESLARNLDSITSCKQAVSSKCQMLPHLVPRKASEVWFALSRAVSALEEKHSMWWVREKRKTIKFSVIHACPREKWKVLQDHKEIHTYNVCCLSFFLSF